VLPAPAGDDGTLQTGYAGYGGMKIKGAPTIIVVAILTVFFSYYIKHEAMMDNFRDAGKLEEMLIGQYIQMSCEFIEQMTVYGNSYLEAPGGRDSELFGMLNHDSASDTFSMDSISGSAWQDLVGNVTGNGAIPAAGAARRELNLALDYNKYFYREYNRLPGITWLYYTSASGFINMYPWIHSDDFAYSELLKDADYYTVATPEENPAREFVWTDVYLDLAGKGFMTTLSSPIYENSEFRGVLSLDFTNEWLSTLLGKEFVSILVDRSGQVIATNKNVKFDRLLTLQDITNYSDENLARLSSLKSGEIEIIGGSHVFASNFKDAPFRLYIFLPVWLILVESLQYVLPVLIICILLVRMSGEIAIRRETEAKLKQSLTELKSYHDILESAAKYDFLTGTLNRRGFKEGFLIKSSAKDHTNIPISLLVGDIDHFKKFNDTYGHAAGDKILIELSGLIKRSVGNEDIVSRWGGEEFLILLHGKNAAEAKVFAEELRQAIEKLRIPWGNYGGINVTMTIGVAGHDWNTEIENTIVRADHAMYVGKENGRNRVVDYDDTLV